MTGPAARPGGQPPPHRRDRLWARTTALVPPWQSPATRADLLQVVKAVVAAVVAWIVAHDLLDLASAFLAPWTALLTVHATVYRSFTRSAQAVTATVLGVMVAHLVVVLAGPGAAALGIALLIGMLAGRLRPIRDEGSTVATTALFIITAGQAEQAPMLLDRFVGTAIGVVAGLLVNVLLLAPLDNGGARMQVDSVCRRLGDLVRDMARGLQSEERDAHEWIEESRQTDEALGRAWELVRHTRESRVANPRRWSRAFDPEDYTALLLRLEEGISQARAIARSVEQSDHTPSQWNEQFRQAWLPILEALGERLLDPGAEVAELRPELESLVSVLSHGDLPADDWPLYGALIDSTFNIVDVVDDVASSRHVRA